MVCTTDTILNTALSPTDALGSAPTMTVAILSPKRACPTMESKWVSEGPLKVTAVISELKTRMQVPLLFSATSLARQRTVPPMKKKKILKMAWELNQILDYYTIFPHITL